MRTDVILAGLAGAGAGAVAWWRHSIGGHLRHVRTDVGRLRHLEEEDRAELDAICEPGHLREVIRDDWTVWLVLFASVLGQGRAAIEARAAEWRQLFPAEGTGDA